MPRIRITLALIAIFFLSACAPRIPKFNKPKLVRDPAISLPRNPINNLTVAVYDCRDTSGQRAPTGVVQELSTAVPQDCTPYLIRALLAIPPKYITLVERENLPHLLRERQIGTATLNEIAQSNGGRASRLHALRVAEVIIDGQVVAYDRKVQQVSTGLQIGGLGGSVTEVTDIVTFGLRAVSVQTGQIIDQVLDTKTIKSVQVGGHKSAIFTTSILDSEMGGAANEPVGAAIASSARSAVVKLIHDGIKKGWWRFRKSNT